MHACMHACLPPRWILSQGQACRSKGRSHGADEGCANRRSKHLKDGVGKASDKGDSSSNEEPERHCWIEVASCNVTRSVQCLQVLTGTQPFLSVKRHEQMCSMHEVDMHRNVFPMWRMILMCGWVGLRCLPVYAAVA